MTDVPDQPNVLLLLTDDHAQWAARCNGNTELHTPSIDHLAATGVRMANAFTPTPVCSPSRASLLTGRLPSQHGVHDYLADSHLHNGPWLEKEILLQERMSSVGYRTGMVGKWHLGPSDVPARGFDYWYSHPVQTPEPADHTSPWPRPVAPRGQYNPHAITDHAVDFLRQRELDRPFFLHVGLFATHSPWLGHPERLVQHYRQASFEDIPEDSVTPFGRLAGEALYPSRGDRREALAQYYASVTEIDEQVGRLIDELEAQGLRESTLVIYTSDHGLNTGHHGTWGKGNATHPYNVFEESIRIPLILSQPGTILAGQVRDEMVTHLDTHTTLLEHVGIEIDPTEAAAQRFPGRSYREATRGKALQDWPRYVIGEYGDLRWIRDRRHKLVRRSRGEGDQLFDLVADPRETIDLLDEPGHREVIDRLDAALETYFEAHEDTHYSGRRVLDLPTHNPDEAWRTDSSIHRIEERPEWLDRIMREAETNRG